ncbi:hypothetical protein [Mucilaginibacter sp. HD30]
MFLTDNVFLILLLLTIIPIIYPLRKFLKRKDINIFDVLLIFSTLFYSLTPIKTLYIDLPELQSEYIHDYYTPFIILCFHLLILVIDVFFTNKYSGKYSALNISTYIRYWDSRVAVKPIYIPAIFILFVLFSVPLTNYSGMTEDSMDSNITAGFGGGNVSFLERTELIFVYSVYPVLILLNYKYILDNKHKKTFKYKAISYISLTIGVICAFLATKSTFLNLFFFIAHYYYTVYKHSLKRKHFVRMFIIVLIFFAFVLPMSQTFRLVKKNLAARSQVESFSQVVLATINMDSFMKSEIEAQLHVYNKRTLGLYTALHWACTRSFRGNGELTFMIFQYLVPQNLKISEANILGDTYQGKGADIGESVLTWYVADWDWIGVIAAILHFVLMFFIWKYFCNVFRFIFKDNKIEFLLVYFYFSMVVNLEVNPYPYIHGFYSQFLIVVATFNIIFKIADLIGGFKNTSLNANAT